MAKAPRHTAADGGFASRHNLGEAKALGVRDVAFHKKAGLRVMDMVKSNWVYRKLRNFRAGIESDIGRLKRAYGLARCVWRGLDHFRAYVWVLQSSPTTSPSSPGSSRSDFPPSTNACRPADPGSISHSDFAPFAADQPSQSPNGSKWRCKPLSFGNKRSPRSQQKQTFRGRALVRASVHKRALDHMFA